MQNRCHAQDAPAARFLTATAGLLPVSREAGAALEKKGRRSRFHGSTYGDAVFPGVSSGGAPLTKPR